MAHYASARYIIVQAAPLPPPCCAFRFRRDIHIIPDDKDISLLLMSKSFYDAWCHDMMPLLLPPRCSFSFALAPLLPLFCDIIIDIIIIIYACHYIWYTRCHAFSAAQDFMIYIWYYYYIFTPLPWWARAPYFRLCRCSSFCHAFFFFSSRFPATFSPYYFLFFHMIWYTYIFLQWWYATLSPPAAATRAPFSRYTLRDIFSFRDIRSAFVIYKIFI